MAIKKKIKKLVKNPKLFVSDALNNKNIKFAKHKISSEHRYTVVSVVCNLEDYLEDYFRSLVNQTLNFEKHIFLILVDDGSEDKSAEIIKKWQKKYLNNIIYIENPISSVLDLGVENVETDMISFIDPRDFVDENYFLEIDKTVKKYAEVKLFYSNKKLYTKDRIEDRYPLKYQFDKDKVLNSIKLDNNFIVTINGLTFQTQWLKKNIMKCNIFSLIKVLYLNFKICYIKNAIYIEREVDNKLKFISEIDNEIIDIRNFMLDNQNTILDSTYKLMIYYTFELVKQVLINKNIITVGQDYIFEIMELIDTKYIMNFTKAGFSFKYRVGFLSMFKNINPNFQILYIKDYDKEKKLLQINYFYGKEKYLEDITLNDIFITQSISKIRSYQFFDETFVNEKIIYIKIDNFLDLKAQLNSKEVRFSLNGKQYKNSINTKTILEYFNKKQVEVDSKESFFIKKIAQLDFFQKKYKDVWLLMDKDIIADDNAEHLYRYILNNHKEINAFFILSKVSKDWNRLEDEGFKLIPFGSLDHKIALIHSINLLSSHAAPFVVSFLSNKFYKNYLKYKFTFLQHGVTKDDISKWMNSRKVDCFICTSEAEYMSIAGNNNNYKMTKKEVVLTGFPRHDTLANLPIKTEKMIMIMPTWRLFLAGKLSGKSSNRELNQEFYSSLFGTSWKSFFHSDKLYAWHKSLSYKIVFFLHPNIEPYLDWFEIPEYIQIVKSDTKDSIQTFFKKASFMVTDYSSVAFEMAFLNKPVFYYQFDHEEFFSGNHSYNKGYFEYENDGFGPIVYREDVLLKEIDEYLLHNKLDKKYQRNIDKAFKYRDGQNSLRVVNAVKNLHNRTISENFIIEELEESITIACYYKNWNFLENVLERIQQFRVLREKEIILLFKTKIYNFKFNEIEFISNEYPVYIKHTTLYQKYKNYIFPNIEFLISYIKAKSKYDNLFEISSLKRMLKAKDWEVLYILLNIVESDIEDELLDQYYYIKGRTYRELGKNDEALKYYAKSLSYNTKPNDALMQYAKTLYEMHKEDKVTKEIILKEFIDNDYTITSIEYDLIERWFNSKHWYGVSVAIELIDINVIEDELLDQYYYIKGRTYRELGKNDEALTAVDLINQNSKLYIKALEEKIFLNYINKNSKDVLNLIDCYSKLELLSDNLLYYQITSLIDLQMIDELKEIYSRNLVMDLQSKKNIKLENILKEILQIYNKVNYE